MNTFECPANGDDCVGCADCGFDDIATLPQYPVEEISSWAMSVRIAISTGKAGLHVLHALDRGDYVAAARAARAE